MRKENCLNKRFRQELIRSLIRKGKVRSQEELREKLVEEGVEVTQATLSRDLKILGAQRRYDPERGYCYSLHEGRSAETQSIRHNLSEAVIGIEFSGNLAVVKTRLGYATGVAFEIDRLSLPEIIGTVGGDDTLLVILREDASRETILRALT